VLEKRAKAEALGIDVSKIRPNLDTGRGKIELCYYIADGTIPNFRQETSISHIFENAHNLICKEEGYRGLAIHCQNIRVSAASCKS